MVHDHTPQGNTPEYVQRYLQIFDDDPTAAAVNFLTTLTKPQQNECIAALENREADWNVLQSIDDVTPRAPLWLTLPGFAALGHYTVLTGVTKGGKSTFLRRFCAAAAIGESLPSLLIDDEDPDIYRDPVKIVWVSPEERAVDDLKPKILAAGMPPGMFRIVNSGRATRDGGPLLLTDKEGLENLRRNVRQWGAKVVIFDGADNFIASAKVSNDGPAVRQITNRLVDWADEDEICIVMVRHEGKSFRESGVDIGTGSIQWTAGTRLPFVFGPEKKNDMEGPRVLAWMYGNLAAASSIRVEVEKRPAEVMTSKGMKTKLYDVAVLGDRTLLSATDMVRMAPGGEDGDRGTLEDATQWLLEKRDECPTIAAKEILKAAKGDGIAERTLKRAKSNLGIKSRKIDGAWCWILSTVPNDVGTVGTVEKNGVVIDDDASVPTMPSDIGIVAQSEQPDTQPCYHKYKRRVQTGNAARELWHCPDCGKVRGGGHSPWRQPPDGELPIFATGGRNADMDAFLERLEHDPVNTLRSLKRDDGKFRVDLAGDLHQLRRLRQLFDRAEHLEKTGATSSDAAIG